MTARAALLAGLALASLHCAGSPARPLELEDLEGRSVDPLAGPPGRGAAFVFVRTDCPISNRYAPELRRLHDRFATLGVSLRLVYPDPDETAERIRAHLVEYSLPEGALRDPRHRLVDRAQARIMPEAVVFLPDGRLVYRGRIDDRYVGFGQARPAPTQRDLERVLEAVARGEAPPFTSTEAVGCFIRDLRPAEG